MNKSVMVLAKSAPVLGADDSVRRAAGLIRASDASCTVATRNGQIIGMVSERAIAGYLAAAPDPEAALDDRIEALIEPHPVFVSSSATLKEAAEIFASVPTDILPVIGPGGIYQGVVSRRDLVGALTHSLRPPTVAGMATPLGVYLTTGSHNGGAGNLGLFLSGVSLMLMIAAASLIVTGLQRAFGALTGIPIEVCLSSTPLTTRLNFYDLPFYLSTALTVVTMLLLLRLSPLSGYHAAEHMTVHAIEVGETLTPEAVSRMPRVHPRCGTNLLAAAGVFLIITTRASNQVTVLIALIAVVVGWRAVGAWLQYFVTTKHPSAEQLANGVAAGRELLARFQDRPNVHAQGFDRIWNMGFLQTASGMAFVGLIGVLLHRYAHLQWLSYLGF